LHSEKICPSEAGAPRNAFEAAAPATASLPCRPLPMATLISGFDLQRIFSYQCSKVATVLKCTIFHLDARDKQTQIVALLNIWEGGITEQ